MMLKKLIVACSCCDVCGEEKRTDLMCSKYTYTDELEDTLIIGESCWSVCNECQLTLNLA